MARTWRGISSRRHRARTSMKAGTATASHSGGQRHQSSSTKTKGKLSTPMVIRFPTAHSTSRTVTYLGETRSQVMPGGSIAAVGIFAFPFGFAGTRPRKPLGWVCVAVFRRDPAEPFDDEPHDDHDQAAAG